jgi:hypothetical protein
MLKMRASSFVKHQNLETNDAFHATVHGCRRKAYPVRSRMKIPATACSAEVATSATKAGSHGGQLEASKSTAITQDLVDEPRARWARVRGPKLEAYETSTLGLQRRIALHAPYEQGLKFIRVMDFLYEVADP